MLDYIYDLNNYLYLLEQNGTINQLEILNELEPFIDLYLSTEYHLYTPEKLTHFNTEDCFNLVYRFLKENYPNKAYLYANIIERDDNIIINNDENFYDMNNLIYERLNYYLKKYQNNKAIELLINEFKESNISKNNYEELLKIIIKINNEITTKNQPFPKLALKKRIYQMVKILNQTKYRSGVIKYNDTYRIEIANYNNIISALTVLHEYIHKDNFIIKIYDEKLTSSEAFNYFKELPSITLETEFINWLYQNNYINEFDYKYAHQYRLKTTYYNAITLKDIKIILDTYNKYKGINDNIIKFQLSIYKNTNMYQDLLSQLNIIENYFYETTKISNTISYLISTIFTPTILKKIEEDYNYRNNLLKVNDNLMDLTYYEVLKILNLDYRKKEILEEITNNFNEHINNYNNIKTLTK